MKMSFWAGALAGFMLGSTKQGCAVRESMTNLFTGFFSSDESDSDESQSSLEAQNSLEDETATFEPGGLDIEKANQMAEKLSAKVSEPQGEDSLPHSHHIDIPTNRLSA